MKSKIALPFILLLAILLTGCSDKQAGTTDEAQELKLPQEILGDWYVVNKAGNSYELIDCSYAGENIQVFADSVSHKGIMEDVNFKIDRIKQDNNSTVIYTGSGETTFYKFEWQERSKGILKWEIQYAGEPLLIRYTANKAGLKNIKKVKGSKDDCITDDESDNATVSTSGTDTGSPIIKIENGNCITVSNNTNAVIYKHCFTDGSMLEIRDSKGAFLPLTFINGPHSIEADFYSQGNQWVTKNITFYEHTPNGHIKHSKQAAISITDFDFMTVAEQFEQAAKP